uniref:Uncharacterized protein n=1 Tax=uncultured marine thaumarchaeote KM3_78_A04 TaxID=1456289 RepID=A0A075HMC7_9ARCH|nr:hypothetical protein [uncultured marine thaumarchaeote KM3_78_A04]
MDHTQVNVIQVFRPRTGGDLSVECVPGLEHHFFAGLNLYRRRYIGMPPVVSLFRFTGTALGVVQLNALHGTLPWIKGLMGTRIIAYACVSPGFQDTDCNRGQWLTRRGMASTWSTSF